MLFSSDPTVLSPIVSSQGSGDKVQSRTLERFKKESCSLTKETFKKMLSPHSSGWEGEITENWSLRRNSSFQQLCPGTASPPGQACAHCASGTPFST